MKLKKLLIFVFLFAFFSFGLIACAQDDSKVLELEEAFNSYKDDSQASIEELEAKLAEYVGKVKEDEATIVELQKALKEAQEGNNTSELQKAIKESQNKITLLESDNQNLQQKIYDLQEIVDDESLKQINNYNKIMDKIGKVEDAVKKQSETSDYSIQVNLADKYYLVVGDTFQLFFRSVIRAVDPYQYYIHLTGDDGYTFNRYYEFTPEKTGNFNLTITVKDDNGQVLGTDSTTLVVSSKDTVRSKKILVIGDSLTASGQWIARGISKFQSAGGTAVTIGTVTKTLTSSTIGSSSNITVNYEGRSGWQWSSYVDKYDSNTISPFKIDGTLSFSKYLTKNNLQTFDEVYIFMTFNGLTGPTTYDFNCSFLQQAKILVDQIHKEYSGAKITLMSLPLTSTYSGCGSYYKVSISYHDNYGVHCRIHEYDNFLETWAKMYEYNSFLRYVDIKGQFDSEYNMPYTTKQVNATNSSVKENLGTSMGMHPSSQGYNQIGDAFFRALMSNWGK